MQSQTAFAVNPVPLVLNVVQQSLSVQKSTRVLPCDFEFAFCLVLPPYYVQKISL